MVPPRVILQRATHPADGRRRITAGYGIAVGTNATATFSEAMDASTINSSTFTLTKQGTTTPITATVTYDGATKKATLTPGTNLDHAATYTATIKGGANGAKDLAGNPLGPKHRATRIRSGRSLPPLLWSRRLTWCTRSTPVVLPVVA